MTGAALAPGAVLGFVGLGNMGAPMARRLVRAGYLLRCHDADAAALATVSGAGATPVPDVRAVAEGAEAVLLMLPSSDVVERVVFADGLLAAMAPGSVLVDMGSSRPHSTREVAARAREHEVAFVDAPVSGGVAGARSGSLTIMAGGRDGDVARVERVLAELGERVLHVGGVGAGHALKALNNLMSATHLLVTSEAVLAGEEFGLDPKVVLDTVNTSSGRSGSTETKWPRYVLTGSYDSGFGARLMVKDMRIAVELARESGWPALLGEHAVRLWSRAAEELDPGADHTEIVEWLRKRHTEQGEEPA
ncbi:NAD(P)-dependent oxidoreductase [Prauserella muralis]|nr:NAD(P)-dependent oxidoreductase [Prauserella muralis]TWE28011.1 3-hydroxyisobutyrate dehydrogenase [Prauserella muralis]